MPARRERTMCRFFATIIISSSSSFLLLHIFTSFLHRFITDYFGAPAPRARDVRKRARCASIVERFATRRRSKDTMREAAAQKQRRTRAA
jgi:hypothetical protein